MPNLTGGNEAVALLLFMLVVPVFTFLLLAPVSSWRSRVQEYEADAYAVSQTPAADLSSALLKLVSRQCVYAHARPSGMSSFITRTRLPVCV